MTKLAFTAKSPKDIGEFFRTKAAHVHARAESGKLTEKARAELHAQELTFIECAMICEATTIEKLVVPAKRRKSKPLPYMQAADGTRFDRVTNLRLPLDQQLPEVRDRLLAAGVTE